MNNSIPQRHRVMWLALATIGTLLLIPTTRSLLGTQLQAGMLNYSNETDFSAARAFAARVPDDYPVQLALAIDLPVASDDRAATQDPMAASIARNRRIEALAQRFPNNPSVYANLLRYMTLDEMRLRRDDSSEAPSTGKGKVYHTSPEAIGRFEAMAQKGAALDPENAYFPMMEAVGLFAAHRDTEALDAFKAAGACSRWNEYLLDDLNGHERLLNAASGEQKVVRRLRTLCTLPFPQYGQLRAAARAAVDIAAEDERASGISSISPFDLAAEEEGSGKTAEGIAIRHALMRAGGIMRARAASAIAPLVGIAIADTGTYRPGGVQEVHPWIDNSDNRTRQQRRVERCDRYCAYLESRGAAAEAAWVKTEIAAGDQAKAIELQGVENPVESGTTYKQFCASWLINLVLLFSAVTLLLLGATAHYARLGRPRTAWETKYLTQTRCVFALSVLSLLGVWLVTAVAEGSDPALVIIDWFSDSFAPGKVIALQSVLFGLVLLTPVLLVGLIAAMSRSQRIPLAVGLGRGLRGTALPVAAALFVLYGVSLLPTAYLQSSIKSHYDRSLPNRPHYFAEFTGKVWPGDPQP